MFKVNLYKKNLKKSAFVLPKDFEEKANLSILAQAIRVYHQALYPRRGKTKRRGEVNRSGAKIWRQKGTGRARHGDLGAPIFVGGGIAHGPRGERRKLTLPDSLRRKALKIALRLKMEKKEIVVVDGIANFKKTKEAERFLKSVFKKEFSKEKDKFAVIVPKRTVAELTALRNIKGCKILAFEDLTAFDVFFSGPLVFAREVFDTSLKQGKAISEKAKNNSEARKLSTEKGGKKNNVQN